jgi:hypothetical protein
MGELIVVLRRAISLRDFAVALQVGAACPWWMN